MFGSLGLRRLPTMTSYVICSQRCWTLWESPRMVSLIGCFSTEEKVGKQAMYVSRWTSTATRISQPGLLFRVQTSLHRSMPALHTLHTATATANTEEIANMVDIAVARDSCMTTIRRQHRLSLARHLLTLKLVAADKKGNEEPPQKMPVSNLLLLLRDERANNNNQLHLAD